MFKMFTVQRHQRTVLLRDGVYRQLYGPGRWVAYTGWSVVEWVHYDTRQLVQPIRDDDVLADEVEGFEVVEVAEHQRAVVHVHGQATELLQPGRYRIWDVRGREVDVTYHDAVAAPAALDDADRVPFALGGFQEQTATAYRALVLVQDGEPVRSLPSGRFRAWTGGPWTFREVVLALRPMDMACQDLVTQDQVPIRVKPGVAYRTVDPIRFLGEESWAQILYGAVQLGLREVIAARDLDALVTERSALSADLLERTRQHLPDVGIVVEAVYVKDVILCGEVRELATRVVRARKEAEAYTIKRRQEVAATRQLANTAKMLTDNPVLLRLKELEALGELADRIDKLVVVGGTELAQQVLRTET